MHLLQIRQAMKTTFKALESGCSLPSVRQGSCLPPKLVRIDGLQHFPESPILSSSYIRINAWVKVTRGNIVWSAVTFRTAKKVARIDKERFILAFRVWHK